MSMQGVIPPVITPLRVDGSLDAESFKKVIDRMLSAGVHGLFVNGSSGEVAFSTDERRDEITRAAVGLAGGQAPILVGAIDTQTNRVIEQARRAEDLGADAIVATAPFYGLGGPQEIERHFRKVAAAISVPLYAYDLPVSVHVKLDPEMLVRLGSEGVLAGVKDSSGDDVSFRRMILMNGEAGKPLSLLTGHEVVVDGAYLGGADGSVPGLANVDPHGYVRMWDAAQSGDWMSVRDEQNRLAGLMNIAFAPKGVTGFGAGVGSFKTALMLLGVISTNVMPEPVTSLKDDNVDAIARVLRDAGLLV